MKTFESWRPGIPSVLLSFLLLSHAVRCLFLFDPVSGIIGREPMVQGDYSLHFACAFAGSQHFCNTGRYWGYDTEFMAGWMDPPAIASNYPLKLLFSLIRNESWLSPALKIFVFLSCALSPLLFALACRRFGLRGWNLLVAASLGLLYWWIGPPYRMVKWGMFLYTACAFFALYVHSLYFTYLQSPSLKHALFFSMAISACFLLHGASAFLLFTPLLVLTIFHWRKQWKWILLASGLSAIGVIQTAYNVYYLTWFFGHRGWILSSDFGFGWGNKFHILGPLIDLIRYRVNLNFQEEAGRASLEALLYVLFFRWLWQERKSQRTPVSLSLSMAALAGFVLTFYSPLIPFLKDLQLFRIKTNFFLYVILMASSRFPVSFPDRSELRSWRSWAWSAIILSALGVSFWHVSGILLHWRPLDGQLSQPARDLVSWIQQNTNEEGRILIEESGYLDDEGTGTLKYFGGYFPALIPFLTGREIVGGPHPYIGGILPGPVRVVPSGHASFVDGYIFRKDVTEIPKAYLREMLNLYNIRWIISWSARARRLFASNVDLVRPLGTLGYFDLYEVPRAGSFFLKGSGVCLASPDSIKLSQVQSEQGEIVLSYHWFNVLETVPPCDIEGVLNPLPGVDDPVPFVRIKNPPRELVIQMKGLRGFR